MLQFFRDVAQTIPSYSPSPSGSPSNETSASSQIDPSSNSARDMLQDRAGIIVLREDLDFYAIPPKADIDSTEMMEVKRAAGRALLAQNGIFSGLRRSEETGTTEQHLIEMLTAGYVIFDVSMPPQSAHTGIHKEMLTTISVGFTTKTPGATVQASRTKPSSAVWPSLGSARTSRARKP